jgi:diguanylate cyclase (GGDEF)-like protein/PAS domain S-box-containing protein
VEPNPRRHRLPRPGRPGLRVVVLGLTAAIVFMTAVIVADTVAVRVTDSAVNEAVAAAESLVRGDIDALLAASTIGSPTTTQAAEINDRLVRLTSAGNLLRIKVWSPDGRVLYSDEPGLRGRSFEMEPDLAAALEGHSTHEIASPTAGENVLEVGLAERLLSIYLPIRDPATGRIIGAYETYEDAAGIEATVAATREEVLLIVGGAGAALLVLVWLAFSGVSKRLGSQNRQLRDQARRQEILATDLRRSEERFRSLVQNSADIILVTNADGTVMYESPAVERVLGYPPGARIDQAADDIVHPDDVATAEQLRATVLAAGGQARAEIRVRHADGDWRTFEAVAADYTADPAVRGIVLNLHDITDRVKLGEQLAHQAFHDALTGLANRALFRDRVGHALSRLRRRRPVAVLFLDLDDFKSVNDSRGHSLGDVLLTLVAGRIEGALRPGDTAARLGGDEFAVLVEETSDAQGPIRVAERILAALREPFLLAGEPVVVRTSVGIALGETGQTTDELLANADLAMYLAKGSGGHRYALYDPSMHLQAAERLALRTDIEYALPNNELFLVFQPILELATREVTGVEALVRWRHPLRGVIGPTTFIPIAEESDQIAAIGAWVLNEACREVLVLDRQGRELSVAVNVSTRQLQDPAFRGTVEEALARTGLAPERLILEVTESVLVRDIEAAVATLQALRSLGIQLAIDDFGTGYSSLTYLHRFPVDILKIDRSFVATLTAGPSHASLVGSIIRMARSLGLRTIAEGIEQEDQLQELRRFGTDEGQGYMLGYPVELSALSMELNLRSEDGSGAAGVAGNPRAGEIVESGLPAA